MEVYKSLYLWIQVISLGLFHFLEHILSSLIGFLFSFVLESIDNILNAIWDIFNEGDHSLSKIFKQINPFEKTKGLTGIFSINVTEGLSKGYNILEKMYYKKLLLTYLSLNWNFNLKVSFSYKVLSAPLKDK